MMNGGAPPPRIYMNMQAGTSDADANSIPAWVWRMLAGVAALAAFGLAMYYVLNAGP